MKTKQEKTNVMRVLDQAKIAYEPLFYSIIEEDFSGTAVANLLGIDPEQCFKTLSTISSDEKILIFTIPVNATLDLKKAAEAAHVKKIQMLHVKDLKSIIGYERGSVSPIGMKKKFPVFIDETATLFDDIELSGGAKGASIRISPQLLADFLTASFADITE